MLPNPPDQYGADHNLRARQRLWRLQDPPFDIVGWVLDLAELSAATLVLDVGCGNGDYLRAVAARGAWAVGCDLSPGMLRTAAHPTVINADVTTLPVCDAAVDVVLAPHMLYHVPDRPAAIRELRRVLVPGGVCVAVTNGARQLASLRRLIEQAVGVATPGWRMRSATEAFSDENAAEQLGAAFGSVTRVSPVRQPRVPIRDASVVADYVRSWAGFYQDRTSQPWDEVVDRVVREVRLVIDRDGAFVVSGDLAAFVCR